MTTDKQRDDGVMAFKVRDGGAGKTEDVPVKSKLVTFDKDKDKEDEADAHK